MSEPATPTIKEVSASLSNPMSSLELYFSDHFMEDEPMYRVFEFPEGFDIENFLNGINDPMTHDDANQMKDENDEQFLKIENSVEDLPIAFYIKGERTAPAILCTDSNSFDITKVDTSNTVLVFDPNSGEIHGRVSCMYEVTPTIVRVREEVEKVLPFYPKNGLSELSKSSSLNSISGNVKFRAENQKQAMTLAELETCIRASRQEILDCLIHECNALCDDESQRWYLLDQKLFFQIYELLLLTLAETSFTDKLILDRESIDKELSQDYDSVLLQHCLQLISVRDRNDQQHTLNLFSNTVEIDIDKICIFNAISLFSSHNKWRLQDFQNTWHESLSSFQQLQGFKNPEVSSLISQGYCVTVEEEKNASQDSIMLYFLDRRSLPSQFKERLSKMFTCKPKWTFNELLIYLAELFPATKNESSLHQEMEAMLRKHCKVQQNPLKKEKYYMMK
ncbi:hypothetical protein FDP41_002863 [Naegleria fowleri]|uniref:Sister chromatid cohesion protein DCC1 n=1 Tax=Naegleria fowleri TaxID=5763 RepID=A0A6A5BX32_NAEFO|nr:uncharacterized protein FDP41_002863 [Naegleria fowleri]KAF0978348.1 hypothetical protein FDP41_002863 [Naegleria fowleri]CAG4719132.1 unnamed protein product [Naegleria fowleri]